MESTIINEGLKMIQDKVSYPIQKLAFKYAYEIEKHNINKIKLAKKLGKKETFQAEINKSIAIRKFSDSILK